MPGISLKSIHWQFLCNKYPMFTDKKKKTHLQLWNENVMTIKNSRHGVRLVPLWRPVSSSKKNQAYYCHYTAAKETQIALENSRTQGRLNNTSQTTAKPLMRAVQGGKGQGSSKISGRFTQTVVPYNQNCWPITQWNLLVSSKSIFNPCSNRIFKRENDRLFT